MAGFALGVGLAFAGVLPGGGEQEAAPPQAQTAVPVAEPETQPATNTAADSILTPTPTATDTATAVAAPATPVAADTQAESEADATGQVAAPALPPSGPGPQVAAVPAVYIVVEGLEVDEVTPNEYQGRSGFRVVQRLDSGDPLTIESYLLGADTAGVGRVGNIQIIPTTADTVLGIVRLPNHLVYASGVLPQDSMRTLLGSLVEREQ